MDLTSLIHEHGLARPNVKAAGVAVDVQHDAL